MQREPFERGLRELGWKPGGNIIIDYRYAEGDSAKLAPLASELVRAKADVIVAAGSRAAVAIRAASQTTPIVMSASNDPVAEGLAV